MIRAWRAPSRLAARQRTAAAAAQLSTASTLWSSVAAEPADRDPPLLRRRGGGDSCSRPGPGPPSSATSPRPRPPRTTPADGPRRSGALFEEYGAAIEARSVEAVRRAYPGLMPAQAREWEEFFRGVSDIQVELQGRRTEGHR